MKKYFLSTLFMASATFGFVGCNNGEYDTDPATNNSGVGNPMNPGGGSGGGNDAFNWSGTDPISLKADGTAWQGTVGTFMVLGGFSNIGGSNGTSSCGIVLPENLVVGETYNISVGNGTNSASYVSDITNPGAIYASTLGTGGKVKILENDATHIKGLFYFNGKNVSGQSVNITEGYFNITK